MKPEWASAIYRNLRMTAEAFERLQRLSSATGMTHWQVVDAAIKTADVDALVEQFTRDAIDEIEWQDA